ncbi:CPBP family intramembrane glutamic endopeptidase [Capnocytophaga catalasegens]|uniref:CAAX amino protease n=1 Tax=Capnocytophaga catalasegens TaxID=1004260 RepID=A0AAV5AZK0_9FLAO|nr:CPBP family intramembrane glutamic endopeptidase [Capnocytophaga catalasegens]GIZ16527.1 CAAX amino protease [Capnocytophaga catalasegens]GJM51455.1 CAAX amino protease [Capnocytophaga catalasegens]GJM53193.1 CAAX amino protease [Capnocytophaga catalasegens]
MNTKSKTFRNVALFSLVAITCGWVGVGVDKLLGQPSNLESLGALIFIATPLLCMLLLRSFGGDGWKDLPLRPNFKQNARWYLFSVAVYPVVIGITLFVGKLLGWADVGKFSFIAYLPILATAFLPEFIKNIFEESVWRGYLTLKMEQLTKNEWLIYLVVALVWQIWHLPYYLILLDDVYVAKFFPYGDVLFVIIGFFVIGIWTIMYTEIFFLSRSLWLVILMHTMEDALNPLISEGFVKIPTEYNWLISPSFGLIPLMIYLAIGLYLRRIRKNIHNKL